MLSPDAPCMRTELRDNLFDLNEYLLNRVWPHRYLDLEHAFRAFRWVLNDLLREFGRYAGLDQHETGIVATEKFYKMDGWLEPEEYDWRVDEYGGRLCRGQPLKISIFA